MADAKFEARQLGFLGEMLPHDPGNPTYDPVIEAFKEGFLESYSQLPAYRALTNDFLTEEKIGNASYQFNKFFKASQALLIPENIRHLSDYPKPAGDPQWWVEFNSNYLSDPTDPMYANLADNLKHLPLQVNRLQRAAGIAYLIDQFLSSESENEGAVVHEYGTGGEQVLRALAMHAFRETVVVDENYRANTLASTIFNHSARRARLKTGIGIELRPPKSRQDWDWIKSCTLNPRQLDGMKGGVYEDAFDLLAEVDLPNVMTIKGDARRLTPSQTKILEMRKAKVAFMGHFISQNAPYQAEIARTQRSRMDKESLTVANEYAYVDPENPQELIVHKRWYKEPWICKSFAKITHRPELGWIPIFEWESAQCDRVRPLKDGLEIVGNSF